MENRIASPPDERPGAELLALVAILAITAAWWALALWPAGATQPDWLARTRAACFGAPRGGLPDAGGWILLIGEPAGMLAALFAVWGRSLRRDARWILRRRAWRFAGAVCVTLGIASVTWLGVRVGRAWALGRAAAPVSRAIARRVDRDPPAISLANQRGQRTSLSDFRGRPVLLAFAFSHCGTVCPALVTDLKLARRSANRPDVALVVITLDPWRDTPDRLPAIAERWGLGAADRILSGGVSEVEQVLDAFGVWRRRDERTGDIDHATVAMLLDRRGRIAWRVDGGWSGVAELLARAD